MRFARWLSDEQRSWGSNAPSLAIASCMVLGYQLALLGLQAMLSLGSLAYGDEHNVMSV